MIILFGMYGNFNNGNYNNRRPMFQGRNGTDALSVCLAGIAFVLFLIYPVFTHEYVQAVLLASAALLAALCIFRMFSKNVGKRRNENEVFLRIFSNSGRRARRAARKAEKDAQKAAKEKRKEDLKTHVFYKCPKCSTELRVPRNKGKIRITCPKCGEKFIKKT